MKYVAWLIFPIWYLLLSCATQTTPMGGPKDSIPPRMVRSLPKPNQINFNSKNAELEFSEMLQLNNPKEEIIIVPDPGKKTRYNLKNNKLIIEPELPWKENTTYNINLREAVKDITEGNITPDQHLAFSTGPIIDTLIIAGSVKNALLGDVPENITVAIYNTDTFNVNIHQPEYFTKTAKTGEFTITNLKAGKYKIYAFDDKNKNLKLETRSEKFGFLADSIRLDSTTKKYVIPLVNLDTRVPKLTSKRSQSNLNTIRFNKSMDTYQLTSPISMINHYASNQTEIIVHYPLNAEEDSTLVRIQTSDSILQKIDTTLYIKRDNRKKIEEKFNVSSTEADYNLETNRVSFSITFNKPIIHINPDSIYIPYDTLYKIPFKTPQLVYDSIHTRLIIDEIMPVDSLPNSPVIRLAKGYLMSIDNDSSKQLNVTLKTTDAQSTATLLLDVQTKEPNYIIELLSSSGKVVQSFVNKKKMEFKYVNPENVTIRAIIDKNANKKWDTANPLLNQEPETIIYYIGTNKSRNIPLRANWEVGPLLFRF